MTAFADTENWQWASEGSCNKNDGNNKVQEVAT